MALTIKRQIMKDDHPLLNRIQRDLERSQEYGISLDEIMEEVPARDRYILQTMFIDATYPTAWALARHRKVTVSFINKALGDTMIQVKKCIRKRLLPLMRERIKMYPQMKDERPRSRNESYGKLLAETQLDTLQDYFYPTRQELRELAVIANQIHEQLS